MEGVSGGKLLRGTDTVADWLNHRVTFGLRVCERRDWKEDSKSRENSVVVDDIRRV